MQYARRKAAEEEQMENMTELCQQAEDLFQNPVLDNIAVVLHKEVESLMRSPVLCMANEGSQLSTVDHTFPVVNDDESISPRVNDQPQNNHEFSSLINDPIDEQSSVDSLASFHLFDEDEQLYRIPESNPLDSSTSSSFSRLETRLRELHTIFLTNGVTGRCQNDILRFIRDLDPTMYQQFPKDHRTLRPPVVSHSIRQVSPGRVIYFGIENILRTPGVILFDKSANEVRLSVNIDGVPVYKTNRMGFWPILASVNQFPVWIIGFYEGPHKPTCANEFLTEFVAEVQDLQAHGIVIENVVYRFVLENILMDAPATSYILGTIGHAGYHCCRKCHVKGESVVLRTVGERHIRGVRYLEIDAEPRGSIDFSVHYDAVADPHSRAAGIIPAVSGHSIAGRIDDFNEEEEDEDEPLPSYVPLTSARLKELGNHHKHPTILSTIEGFDLVKQIPLDYMHLVCEGVVKRLLTMYVDKTEYKMPKCNINTVNQRLTYARQYKPKEFQRPFDSLDHLSSWKATQFRSFMLYIGPIVLDGGMLMDARLHHFHLLVVAMRLLACKVNMKSPDRHKIIDQRAAQAEQLLRAFVTKGITLYSAAFAVYNVHNLLHATEDYRQFGPIDLFSCFKYESFLAVLKWLVTGHFQPGKQVINKYSALLQTQQFAKDMGNREFDYVQHYYEVPELKKPVLDDIDEEDIIKHERYLKMRFQNFVLCSDVEKDSYCVAKKSYAKVVKILRDRQQTNKIYIAVRVFCSIRPIFSLPDFSITSQDVGMVYASQLTQETYLVPYSDITEKCFALPGTGENHEWTALVRFLH